MRYRGMIGAVALGMFLVAAAPVAGASTRLPDGSSTFHVPAIEVDPYTGTADTFSEEVTLLNGQGSTLVIVNFTFPNGVTMTGASIDTGNSTCTDETGTVTYSGNQVRVKDIACANGQTLAVDVDGASSITTSGYYDVSSEFKTQAPRRPQQQTTMWQEIEYDVFEVLD